MLSRDYKDSKGSSGGGLLWKSKDGLRFDEKETTRAFEDLAYYLGKPSLRQAKIFRGNREGQAGIV